MSDQPGGEQNPPQFPLFPPPPVQPGGPPHHPNQPPHPGGEPAHPGQFTQAQWQQLTPEQWRAAWRTAYPPSPRRFEPVATIAVCLVVVLGGAYATSLIARAPGVGLAIGAMVFAAGLVLSAKRGRPLVRGAGLGAVIGTAVVVVIGGSAFAANAVASACVQAFSPSPAPVPTVTGTPFPNPSTGYPSVMAGDAGTP